MIPKMITSRHGTASRFDFFFFFPPASLIFAITRLLSSQTLTAFKEVEASLAAFQAQRERHAILQEQAAAAQASADTQRRRLELGIGDYVAYLDALRQSLNVLSSSVTAERELALARLNVHRALGGSWIELEEGS